MTTVKSSAPAVACTTSPPVFVFSLPLYRVVHVRPHICTIVSNGACVVMQAAC